MGGGYSAFAAAAALLLRCLLSFPYSVLGRRRRRRRRRRRSAHRRPKLLLRRRLRAILVRFFCCPCHSTFHFPFLTSDRPNYRRRITPFHFPFEISFYFRPCLIPSRSDRITVLLSWSWVEKKTKILYDSASLYTLSRSLIHGGFGKWVNGSLQVPRGWWAEQLLAFTPVTTSGKY